MSPQDTDNTALERRFIEHAFNKGELDVVDDLFADDYVGHTSTSPEPLKGPAGMKAYIEAVRDAFPDIELRLEHVLAADDLVASHWVASGTHEGEFQGLPPTGNTYDARGMEITRIEAGEIVEQWHVGDQLGMLQQLDVLPENPGAGGDQME